MGFDAAASIRSNSARNLLRYIGADFNPLNSVKLQELAKYIEPSLNRAVSGFPEHSVNFLFQYKRPEYLSTRNAKEHQYWGKSYYRYTIEQSQLELLDNLQKYTNDRCVAVYASPVARDVIQLCDQSKNGEIVNSSNFVKADQLLGHSKVTYINPGGKSILFSEPTKYSGDGLVGIKRDAIDRILGTGYGGGGSPSIYFMIEFSQIVDELMQGSPTLGKKWRYFTNDWHLFEGARLSLAFFRMRLLHFLLGIGWSLALH